MGDCSEVFLGLAQFLVHAINRNADIDKAEVLIVLCLRQQYLDTRMLHIAVQIR